MLYPRAASSKRVQEGSQGVEKKNSGKKKEFFYFTGGKKDRLLPILYSTFLIECFSMDFDYILTHLG